MSNDATAEPVEGIQLYYPESPFVDEVLDRQVLLLVSFCEGRFRDQRLGQQREVVERRNRCHQGVPPTFDPETESIRLGSWAVAPPPADFRRRRVEVVTTLNPNALVNGLASGADSCVVDIRDSLKIDSSVLLRGQMRIRQAASGTLAYESPIGTVVIGEDPASLVIRPRLLTETEQYLTFEGNPVSAGVLDVIAFVAHSASDLIQNGKTPCLELAVSDPSEAKLWLEILESIETLNRLPRASVRVSLALESLSSFFAADEILYVFRDRAVGLSHGTWRCVQDFIESFPYDARMVHPDRSRIWELEYCRFASRYLVQVAHKRGTLAIAPCGQHDAIDAEGLRVAGERLVTDVVDDISEGFDGKRIVCSRLTPVVERTFDTAGIADDQRTAFPYAEGISQEELLRVSPKPITEYGLRTAIRVGLAQLASWTSGRSMLRLDHFLETRASAAVARLLLHQWIRHPNGILSEGVEVTRAYVREVFAEELRRLSGAEESLGCSGEDLLSAVRVLASSLASDATVDVALDSAE